MNYLALAQRLRRKCRVSGTGPSAVTAQTEEYNRLLDWVNEAYMSILRRHEDWDFMRKTATCATVQGQLNYQPTTDFGLTDFGYWAVDYENGDTFRNYVTATGSGSEVFMELWDYDWWRDAYLYGALRTTYARPMGLAVAPDKSIVTGPIAEAGYTLTGDYYAVPTEMVAATDLPIFPTQFHQAIVYQAMMYYGASEAAPEVYGDGEKEFNKIIREMERNYLRRPQMAGALA